VSNLTVGAVIIAFWNEHLLELLPGLFLGVLPLGHTPGHICGEKEAEWSRTGKKLEQEDFLRCQPESHRGGRTVRLGEVSSEGQGPPAIQSCFVQKAGSGKSRHPAPQ
jgi:hypothetical protein